LSTEDTDFLQDNFSNDHIETNTELLLDEELTLPLEVNEPENIEEQDPEIDFENLENPTSKAEAKFAKIISDQQEKKHNTSLHADPLLTYAWKVQTFEAYYYLERLQKEFQNDPTVFKEIREQIKSSLESC
ncbi:10884_t:CDS:2, partial [Gigaspora rosea]